MGGWKVLDGTNILREADDFARGPGRGENESGVETRETSGVCTGGVAGGTFMPAAVPFFDLVFRSIGGVGRTSGEPVSSSCSHFDRFLGGDEASCV